MYGRAARAQDTIVGTWIQMYAYNCTIPGTIVRKQLCFTEPAYYFRILNLINNNIIDEICISASTGTIVPVTGYRYPGTRVHIDPCTPVPGTIVPGYWYRVGTYSSPKFRHVTHTILTLSRIGTYNYPLPVHH